MKLLCETDQLVLACKDESVWIKDKLTGKILYEEEFYGNPECGLIDLDGKWVVIAGEHLTIWTSKNIEVINNEQIQWVTDIRLKSSCIVELLTDPWGGNSAIWEINVKSHVLHRIADFNDYNGSEYVDTVIW